MPRIGCKIRIVGAVTLLAGMFARGRTAAIVSLVGVLSIIGATSASAQTQAPVRVTTIDLGSLAPGTLSLANAVNIFGQVVGESQTLTPGQWHAFLWQHGTMTDLGTLGGGGSNALAINNRGQVVGWADTANGQIHAFLWQNGTMTDLGVLPVPGGCPNSGPDETSSQAVAISDSGEIVGYGTALSANGQYCTQHAIVWQNGTMTDLGTLGGDFSTPAPGAHVINDQGQVIGDSTTASGDVHGFIWQNGTMTDLGTLGGNITVPESINPEGQVVGDATLPDGTNRPFLWQAGIMTDLGMPSGYGSGLAVDVNIFGDVAGSAGSPTLGFDEPVLWRDGTATNLGTFGGDSVAVAVNDFGQVAGVSRFTASKNPRHAFLWQNGTMTDLGTLGGNNSTAAAINDAGEVVGQAQNSSGGAHAVMWITRP